jgi:hypothetical protein
MKRIRIFILTALVVGLFSVAPFQATGKEMPSKTPPMTAANMQILAQRVQEIREMDMSTLERSEKKELKSELREINKEIKRNGGGIYLSVGALLVVIILLILLL